MPLYPKPDGGVKRKAAARESGPALGRARQAVGAQQRGELLGRDGASEEVALRGVETCPDKEVALRRGFDAAFGYPAEIIPLANPYALRRGATLRVRVVVDGKPVANQYILFGGRDASGARIEQRNTRSSADGTARIPLTAAGDWYIKFIHMTRVTADTVDYESKWATLTFGVRQ